MHPKAEPEPSHALHKICWACHQAPSLLFDIAKSLIARVQSCAGTSTELDISPATVRELALCVSNAHPPK